MSHGLAMRIAESVGVPVTSIEPLPAGGVRVTARSHVSEQDAQKLLRAFEACALPGQLFEVVIDKEPMHKWVNKVPGTMSPVQQIMAKAAKEAQEREVEARIEEEARRLAVERGIEFERLREEFGAVVDEALGRKP